MATRITRRDATLQGAHRPRHRRHNDGSAASCHFGSTEPCHPTEIEQVLTRFGFGNLVGRPSKVYGGLADGAEVHLLRTFGETGQLQILVHTLAKSGADPIRLDQPSMCVCERIGGEDRITSASSRVSPLDASRSFSRRRRRSSGPSIRRRTRSPRTQPQRVTHPCCSAMRPFHLPPTSKITLPTWSWSQPRDLPANLQASAAVKERNLCRHLLPRYPGRARTLRTLDQR